MRREFFLAVLAVLFGLIQQGQSTTCVSKTLTTCEKSLYMTGSCKDGTCACVSSDYTPGPFGCQVQQTASISAPFTGVAEVGAMVTLTCKDSGIGADTYEWYKGTTKDADTDHVLQIVSAAAGDNGDYTCKSNIAGILSHASSAFTLDVKSSVTTIPVVSGMPTNVIVGQMVTFTCSPDGVLHATGTIVWKFDNTVVPGESNPTYIRIVLAGDASKTVKCAYDSLESAEVTFPSSFVADIEGVEISEGPTLNYIKAEDFTLTCLLSGDFADHVALDTTVTYTWKRGTNTLTGSENKLTVTSAGTSESGSYTCEGKVGSKTAHTSSAVTVTVSTDMEKDDIERSSLSFVQGGYFTLTCNYKSVSTSSPVTYQWYIDGDLLPGVTDKILQFNDVSGADYDGDYSCKVTGAAGSVTSDEENVRFSAKSDVSGATGHSVSVIGSTPEGIGNTLTLECETVLYLTPGLSYVWKVDGQTQDGEVLSTFKYKPVSSTPVDIKCAYAFDGETSADSSAYTIDASYILSVEIHVEDVMVSQPMKPVGGTTVKLECVVEKSEGAGSVTYVWLENDVAIPGETSKYYERTVGASGSGSKSIKCEATASSETDNDLVSIEPQGTAETPTIIAPNTFVLGSDVSLSCFSASYANDAVFEWSKGGNVISGETSYTLTIKDLEASDNGDYTCKITVGSQTSSSSAAETVTGVVNEVTCDYASDCDGANFDSTVCDSGKCQCMSGYTLKNRECSGCATLVGSLMLIMAAVLSHKLF